MPLHEALMLTVGDQFAHEECLRKAKKHRLSRGAYSGRKLAIQPQSKLQNTELSRRQSRAHIVLASGEYAEH